jgi:hypothetical protein
MATKKITVKAYKRKSSVKAHTRTVKAGAKKKATPAKRKAVKSKEKIVYIPSEKAIRVYSGSTVVRSFGNVSTKDATISYPPLKRWLKVNRYDGPMMVKKATGTAKKKVSTKRKPVVAKKRAVKKKGQLKMF